NLLEIGGASPAEYGRRILEVLFTSDELATHCMPRVRRQKPRVGNPLNWTMIKLKF
ncbi:unnamed protein product, partial [Didymodactylos carnosus]